MASERTHADLKQDLNVEPQSVPFANKPRETKASEKEYRPFGVTSSISSSSNSTDGINNDFSHEAVAEPAGNVGCNSELCQDRRHHSRDESEAFKVMQSNDRSRARYVTGYNPYATRSSIGVDGRSLGTNPSISVAVPTASLKSRQANTFKMSGSIDAKASLNSKSFLSIPSSNLSRYSLQILQGTALNKAIQMRSNFGPTASQRGSYSARNDSSPSNQIQAPFSAGPSSYRPNAHTVVGYNGYKAGEKSYRSSLFEDLKESSRGPRSHGQHNMFSGSDQELFGSRVEKERYNRPDFQAVYENAKFFIIKSYSEEDVHKSIKYDVWSSTPNGNNKLNDAFHDVETKYKEKGLACPIFLFFSVNGSGQFLGLAEMIGPVDFDKNMDFWQQDKWSGFFPVRWHIVKDIPNTRLRHIILEYNENKPVTYTRDTQEVRLKEGLEMLSVFKNYSAGTSMLDDYRFYEDQAKSVQMRKIRKEESPQYDIHGSDFPGWNSETGHRKADLGSARGNSKSEQFTTLAALRNLSLNHRH